MTNLNEASSGTTTARAPYTCARDGACRKSGRADECLQLFARAVQQLHTYPSTSPLCLQAIDAWHRALSLLEQRDHLDFRVAPHELTVDEVPVGPGTLVETELARRLHAAGIAQVTIERAASTTRADAPLPGPADLHAIAARSAWTSRRCWPSTASAAITLRQAYRPEVLGVDRRPAPSRRWSTSSGPAARSVFASGGPVNHLYPPDKGWVRLDPATRFSSVSLVDLALLVDDPSVARVDALRADRRRGRHAVAGTRRWRRSSATSRRCSPRSIRASRA